MKIKRKVQKNLPQLIEWGWDNDMRNKNFESEGGAIVYFDYDGNLTCARGFVPQDFFTVTYEEDITEDTVLPKMLVKFKNPDTYGRFKNDSINGFEIEEGNIEAFYILNDDLTMTLIWTHEKGLVE